MPLFPPGAMSLTRRIAQNYILSGIRRGLPGTQVIGVLQQQKVWYKSTDFSKDWAYWKAGWEKGQDMRYTTRDARIGSRLYMQNRWALAARYETVMEIRGRDLRTGERVVYERTISHTHLEAGMDVPDREQRLTRRELETRAREALSGSPPEADFEIDSILPVMGYFNPEIY